MFWFLGQDDTLTHLDPWNVSLNTSMPSCLIVFYFFYLQAVDLVEWYCEEFKDALMAEPPVWFKSFVACELTMQFPFFFVACYAFWKGNNLHFLS